MRRRVVVLLALVLVWVPVSWFRANDQERADLVEVARALDDPDLAWSREDLYYGYTNMQRLTSPYQIEQVAPDLHTNPNRIRVLVLGDSFTYGWGSTDLDSRWPRRFEDELNARTKEGTFEVVTLAAGGASTATQAGWLQHVARGDFESLGVSASDAVAFSAPFDAVVLGYVDNDVIANPYDEFIAEGAYVATAPEDEYRIVSGEMENPNAAHFLAAVAAIKEFAGPAPALWVPLDYSGALTGSYDLVKPVFVDAGFIIADARRARTLAEQFDPLSLMVDPVDSHPGPPLLAAFATDATDALLPALDPVRLEKAMTTAAPIRRSLVSNYHPTSLTVSTAADSKIQISSKDTASLEYTCAQFTVSGTRSSSCEGGVMSFVVNERTLPAQYVACSYLARPYVQVMLDRHLTPGATATLTLSTASPPLDVYTFGYDENGFRVHALVARVHSGKSVDVVLGTKDARGILLAEEGSSGCSDESPHAIRFEAFALEVDVRHG